MTRPVVTTRLADGDIRRINRWWRVHRHASPLLFVEELAAAFDLIGAGPLIGRRYRSLVPDVRRVLMRATRYHVYYVIEPGRVVVIAVWAAVRGRGPAIAARAAPTRKIRSR